MDESDIFLSSGNTKFKIKRTPENGNCFFHAVSYLLALIGVYIHPAPLRMEVVRCATENWEKYKDFAKVYETSEGYVTDSDAYASYMGADLTYARKCELEVVAEKFSLSIRVYSYITGRLVDWYGKQEGHTCYLLVSGQGDRLHFDAITKMEKPIEPKDNIELQMLKSYIYDHFVTKNKTFRIIRVPGDGNCFFHSASYLLSKTGLCINPQDLRQQVVQYVVENWASYQPYSYAYETADGMLTDVDSYATYMGKNCTYAGEIELAAVSNKYSLYIRIYNCGTKDIMTSYGDPEHSEANLLFTGSVTSGHYDALEPEDPKSKKQRASRKRRRGGTGSDDDEPKKKRRRDSSSVKCKVS